MTGESLSSYYEEQKGGKKVEIGGEKGGTGDGTRSGWLSPSAHGKKGKEPVLLGKNGRKERDGRGHRVRLFVLTRIYFPVRGNFFRGMTAALSWDSYSTLLCHRAARPVTNSKRFSIFDEYLVENEVSAIIYRID